MNSNPEIIFTIFGTGSLKKCHDLSWLPIVYDAFFECMSIKNYDWGFFSALDNPFFTCEFLVFRSLVDEWFLSRQRTKSLFFKKQNNFVFQKFESTKTVSLLWMISFLIKSHKFFTCWMKNRLNVQNSLNSKIDKLSFLPKWWLANKSWAYLFKK